jgi:hypothetical protein
MVKYAENSFERIINKLVIISIFVIIIMLFIELLQYIEYIPKNYVYTEIFLIIDRFIILIFIIDLYFIYKKRSSFKSFLKKNWLDILACIPINFFRTAKIFRLNKLNIIAKTILISRTTKLFSKETDIDNQIEYTKEKIFNLKLNKNEKEMNKIIRQINELNKI